MNYFIYNSSIKEENFTIIFDCKESFNEPDLSEDIKEYMSRKTVCERVIYIYPKSVDNLSINIKEEINGVLNKPFELILIPYDENGIDSDVNTSQINFILEEGLVNIIVERNVLLESDNTFHYILPSKTHSPFFIRAGNMLSSSEEINFIAFILLSKISFKDITEIVCDSSSIINIPYALSYLRGIFGEKLNIPFKSFGSYEKVDDFVFRAGSLVLISASNSGRLQKKIYLQQKDIQIFTIIFNSINIDKNITLNHLIDIKDYFNRISINKIKDQWPDSNCKYCNKNSIPVLVRNEQFIPSRSVIQKVLIRKDHLPKWIENSKCLFAGTKSISVFRSDAKSSSKRRDIYLDLIHLYKSKQFLFINLINNALRNYLPFSVNLIVYVDDDSSKFFANVIFKYINQTLNKKIPRPIPHTEIKKIKSAKEDSELTILAIASCITTGNRLNSISRDLRRFKNSSIHYWTIISRLQDKERLRILKNNLSYKSKNNIYSNKFLSLIDCSLPDYHDKLLMTYTRPSWDEELNFLSSLGKGSDDYLNSRLEELKKSAKGLVDNLFYISPFTGRKLTLRDNFAFYDFENIKKVTQADVYFIMSSIIHCLRNPNLVDANNKIDSDKFLIQHEHVKTIIDPECFKRYNDGIIQACILRIARPSELDYSLNADLSLEMYNTLIDLFKDPENFESNEALLEFLYAFAINKVQLMKVHHEKFIKEMEKKYSNNSLVDAFLLYLRVG